MVVNNRCSNKEANKGEHKACMQQQPGEVPQEPQQQPCCGSIRCTSPGCCCGSWSGCCGSWSGCCCGSRCTSLIAAVAPGVLRSTPGATAATRSTPGSSHSSNQEKCPRNHSSNQEKCPMQEPQQQPGEVPQEPQQQPGEVPHAGTTAATRRSAPGATAATMQEKYPRSHSSNQEKYTKSHIPTEQCMQLYIPNIFTHPPFLKCNSTSLHLVHDMNVSLKHFQVLFTAKFLNFYRGSAECIIMTPHYVNITIRVLFTFC